ncbi:unnamed protein product [Haemonchus placei]|uniref:Secreted protein n=1 Tax=Haemonchus placei TaxID=6290 RepID=A0A0N4X942_HAEPC|nr:unnamed protein product [Haemonchus placei]
MYFGNFLLVFPLLANAFEAFEEQNCPYGVCSEAPPPNLTIAPFGSGLCTGDDVIIEHILHDYNKLELPGGGHVKVSVEV